MPQTSPTPTATRPSVERGPVRTSRRRRRARGVIAAETSTPVSAAKSVGLRQERALNDRGARHFVVALAAQQDLLGHAPEGLAEIGKVRDRIAQLVEQRGVELVALERGEGMGVEPDRAVEPAQTIAHPADDVDQQRGRRMRDLGKRVASDSQDGNGRAGAHGRRTRQSRERAEFADEAGASMVEIGIAPRALSAVTITSPLENQHGACRSALPGP